jgi:uncharacterized protein
MKLYTLLACLLLLGCTAKKHAASDNYANYTEHLAAHRETYKANFLEAEPSPLTAADLPFLQFYPADERYKIKADFSLTANAKPFEINTSSGKTQQYIEYGKATFTLKDTVCVLTVYQNLRLKTIPTYKDYLFVPFKDFTCGATTYGGGRYLDMRLSDIEGNSMTIDFNKAYNPYCAYQSEGWNCPIPPEENHLSLHIEAGERNFLKE